MLREAASHPCMRNEREEKGMKTQSIANEHTAKKKDGVRAELNKEGVENIGKSLRNLLADVFLMRSFWQIEPRRARRHLKKGEFTYASGQ